MNLTSDSFRDGGRMPDKCAFARPHPEKHLELSDNKNPHLAWSDLPAATKSLVLICHDPDVPSSRDNVNKEGITVSADLPRLNLYHWVLVDLPPDAPPIQEGEFSDGVTPRGKDGPHGPRATRQGINGYTPWFEGDENMAGDYFGYDGPCPPWNDEIAHHYHFTLYSIDMERCPVEGPFTGTAVVAAIEGHILGHATTVGTYTTNPSVTN